MTMTDGPTAERLVEWDAQNGSAKQNMLPAERLGACCT